MKLLLTVGLALAAVVALTMARRGEGDVWHEVTAQ